MRGVVMVLRLAGRSLVVLVALSLIVGVAYPLVVTGIARGIFPRQAAGSLLEKDGKVVGSALIGQPFTDPAYFWPRPSATTPFAYNAAASAGSNLGPTNPTLLASVSDRVRALRAADPSSGTLVPVDLVTSSGSGLDPHISPAAAEYQAARVARARGLDLAVVEGLIARHTQGRQFGLLGEPRVNVLELNLALDGLSP